ncbi:hypothetical protein [Burkholderia mayonis]|uniref:hypothetical protein n=1 Tax=Burkholderia mayonis TaxID=1385591 RepID=UPI001396C9B3|nr:hypothetical protein [Burkholderia mayonis]
MRPFIPGAAERPSAPHRAPLIATIRVEQHGEQQNAAAYQILVKHKVYARAANVTIDAIHDAAREICGAAV